MPAFWVAQDGSLPTVVGGDLNLEHGWIPDIQDCVPDGWYRKGDDAVQHWFITDDLAFNFSRAIDMEYTDHPALSVTTVAP